MKLYKPRTYNGTPEYLLFIHFGKIRWFNTKLKGFNA